MIILLAPRVWSLARLEDDLCDVINIKRARQHTVFAFK